MQGRKLAAVGVAAAEAAAALPPTAVGVRMRTAERVAVRTMPK